MGRKWKWFLEKNRNIVGLIIVFSAMIINSQKRPFPQEIKYPYGYIPTTIPSVHVKSEYDRWKKALIEECSNGGCRVKGDPTSETRVEAIGFAMLSSAYFGDKELFDCLLAF